MHSTATFASLFSGIAGLDYGLHARMRCTAMVEKNEHARAVLRRHFPETPILEDVRNVNGTDLGDPTVLVGGFPCKQTSKGAVTRTGLHGKDSGLFYEQIRLIDEARPEWVIIENPDGALTSNGGRDWWHAQGSLGDLGYGYAWRLLDGGHLDTLQDRPRLIMVGHRSGDPTVAWSVLDDTEAGAHVPAASALPGHGPGRPAAAHDGGGPRREDVTVWRKSANARASIEEGGWETWVRSEVANTLACYDPGGPLRQKHLLVDDDRLRTLTLTEWERLSGFPDDWTVAPGVPPTARFTMLGNCVHTKLGEWVAARLAAVMDARAGLALATA
jgi:DNA (cytosine-5)-methyltransferase 1